MADLDVESLEVLLISSDESIHELEHSYDLFCGKNSSADEFGIDNIDMESICASRIADQNAQNPHYARNTETLSEVDFREIISSSASGAFFQVQNKSTLPDRKQIDLFKERLISGSAEETLSAIESALESVIRSPELRDSLVDNGIVDFLNENINSSENEHGISATFTLIRELIKSPLFTYQNRARLLVLSLLRMASEVVQYTEKRFLSCTAFDLVSKIIVKMSKVGKRLNSFCRVEQLVICGKSILEASNEEKTIICSVTALVDTIVSHCSGILFENQPGVGENTLFSLAIETYNTLCKMTYAQPDLDLDVAICKLGQAFMEEMLLPVSDERENMLLETLQSRLKASICHVIVPHISYWSQSIDDNDNINTIVMMLSFVKALYIKTVPHYDIELTALFESHKFLRLLPAIDSLCKDENQHSQVSSLLAELMACLATEQLGADCDWRNVFNVGFASLLCDNGGLGKALFLSDLDEPSEQSFFTEGLFCINRPSCITILAFLYFEILDSPSSEIPLQFYNDLCKYFQQFPAPREKPKPVAASICKALWLCFAVGHTRYGDSFYYAERMRKSVLTMVLSYKLDKIFTHHPAILWWAFMSGNTNEKFQMALMNRWLDAEAEAEVMSEDLKMLLSQSKEAIYVYLKLLVSRCKDQASTESHLEVFPQILQMCDDEYRDDVANDAWILLPKALIEASNRREHFGTVPMLIICSQFAPARIDQDLLLKISSIIPGAFDYQQDDFASDICKHCIVFQFINCLIGRANETNKLAVLSSFLDHEGFILAMERGLTVHENRLTLLILDLLTVFLSFQRQNLVSSCHSIECKGNQLTELTFSENPDLKLAAVRMLYPMIPDEISVTLVMNMTSFELIDLRNIYYRLHTIASRVALDEDDRVLIWACLHRLLKYVAGKDYKFGQQLARCRLTYDLLCESAQDAAICAGSSFQVMSNFVIFWSKFHSRSGPDALGPTLFDKTIGLWSEITANIRPENSQSPPRSLNSSSMVL